MLTNKKILLALGMALLSTMFLSSGLLINSLLAWKGNHWAWTASLRFLLLIPLLLVILLIRKELKGLVKVMRKAPLTFIKWGCIGFGIYYAFLSYAAVHAPGWIVTASFQTTVLAGPLLSPFIYKDERANIKRSTLITSSILVISLLIMQADKILHTNPSMEYLGSIFLSLIAAFLWPLGNRKVMLELDTRQLNLNPMQKVMGMSLGSLPVLLLLAAWGSYESGMPSRSQLLSSGIAVLISGVLGFVMFFNAMNRVRVNSSALAAVEGMQITGVLFILAGEMLFKNMSWPGNWANLGTLVMSFCLVGCILTALKIDWLRFPRRVGLVWQARNSSNQNAKVQGGFYNLRKVVLRGKQTPTLQDHTLNS